MAARSLSREYQKTLQAQIKMGPQQFMAEQTLQPLYQSLNLQNIDYLLNGAPEQDYTNYTWQPAIYSNTKGASQGGFKGGLFNNENLPGIPGVPGSGGPMNGVGDYLADIGGLSSAPGAIPGVPGSGLAAKLFGIGKKEGSHKLLKKGYWKPEQIKRGAQRGLLQIFEQDVLPSQIRQATQQRSADIADVKNLSPAAREALRVADPQSARLLDQLNEQADSELAMGTDLDPSLSRLVSQAIRGRQTGTLMSNGDAGAFQEAMGMGQFGQQIRDQRRGFAGEVIAGNRAFYGDPLSVILSRSNGSAALPFAQQAAAIGSGAGPKNTNYESAYAGDLYNSNFNSAIAQAINKANNQTALIGAGISAAGGIAGGAMGAFS